MTTITCKGKMMCVRDLREHIRNGTFSETIAELEVRP